MKLNIDKDIVRQAFDDMPLVFINGRKFIINPLTEQIPATSSVLLGEAAKWIIAEGNFRDCTKLATEEDKGGILLAAVSLLSGQPFGIARWYPSGVDGQIKVDFNSEYTNGSMFLNGVDAGDQVIIVDDMISTGGTLIGLVRAIQSAKATIRDIICVGEKVEYGGVAKVEKETGIHVKTLVKISISGVRSKILY